MERQETLVVWGPSFLRSVVYAVNPGIIYTERFCFLGENPVKNHTPFCALRSDSYEYWPNPIIEAPHMTGFSPVTSRMIFKSARASFCFSLSVTVARNAATLRVFFFVFSSAIHAFYTTPIKTMYHVRYMNTTTSILGGVAAVALVAAALFSLQSFDAGKVSCDAIPEARAEVQALFDAGVAASVQVFAEERTAAEEHLSHCLNAKPVDPCADAQAARDAAVEKFHSIPSPADSAPYAEFQTYFAKRDDAYAQYKDAKSALDQCRAANPPKSEVPYEESDTKACFDAYDASLLETQNTFTKNTHAMRAALTAALAALDAREKACNPPKGKEALTDPIREGADRTNILNCRLLDPAADPELAALNARAAQIPLEIQAIMDGIENITKRESTLRVDLADVATYIPPESTKTQFEGALNALRAERKVNIESALEFYENLRERREGEQAALEAELRDVEAAIQARTEHIRKENEARERAFPTSLRLAKPDKCDYYHCHGTLCGMPDPAADECGHGVTTENDLTCSLFFDSYLKEAGVQ